MNSIACKNPGELFRVAQTILEVHINKRIFLFYGTMGSGKTTLIKEICRELGVAEMVNSPSFSIVNEYKTVSGNIIYHFDFFSFILVYTSMYQVYMSIYWYILIIF